ncbi:MAG: transglutaminase-like domain-containing protein [Phycisphaerales bacterium]|jgi:hypothetical protein|nr:transglutaminase-like domain-containing protein [Phycisphaerales bacterium]
MFKLRNIPLNRPQFWGRFIFAFTLILSIAASTQETGLSPPLKKTDKRIYNFVVQAESNNIDSKWPILPKTCWSYVDASTIVVTNTSTGEDISETCRREENEDFVGQWNLLIPSQNYKVQFTSSSFSSELDEEVAAKIPWPEEWDEEFEAYLQPSRYIQSDDQVFKNAVAENGNPKSVSIHTAAKVLIRYCLQYIHSDGQYSRSKGSIFEGLEVKGARYAANKEKGSAVDLVCVCIATLRAAGIPSRPVVGITVADTVGTIKIDPTLIVWGEYALPNVGWVPFNPKRMKGTVQNLPLNQPWQGLGTMQWLNRRMPIAWNFEIEDLGKSKQQFQMRFVSSPSE